MAKLKDKKKGKKAKVDPVELIDPVFPLPAESGLPAIRQGEGHSILMDTDSTRVVELPYRAFWILWEYAERHGAKTYQGYKDGPLDHVAQAYLEAVIGLRNAERAKVDLAPLVPYTPKEERKLRKKQKTPKAATPSPNGSKPAASESKADPEPTEEARCDSRHKIDGKKRRCVRKPDHKGRHKDRKGKRW